MGSDPLREHSLKGSWGFPWMLAHWESPALLCSVSSCNRSILLCQVASQVPGSILGGDGDGVGVRGGVSAFHSLLRPWLGG